MKMVHSLHKTEGTVLYDDCHACNELAAHIEEMDDERLQWLAEKADLMKGAFDHPETHDLSMNERRAISRLRLYARVVFKSGITKEVAR